MVDCDLTDETAVVPMVAWCDVSWCVDWVWSAKGWVPPFCCRCRIAVLKFRCYKGKGNGRRLGIALLP